MLYLWRYWTYVLGLSKNKSTGQIKVNVTESQEESKEETKVNNPPEDGESLMLKIFLVKIEK